VIRRLSLLVAGSLLFWVLAAVPVNYLGGGDVTWRFSGTALLLCLVPGLITLAWASRADGQDAGQQLTALLGATGVRLFGVLLVALYLYLDVPPYRGQDGFLVWLIVCYLFTLALEMTLLLKGRPRPDSPA
jgi:hypothetical protein